MTKNKNTEDILKRGYKLFKVETTKKVQQHLAVKGEKLIFGSIYKIHKSLYGY